MRGACTLGVPELSDVGFEEPWGLRGQGSNLRKVGECVGRKEMGFEEMDQIGGKGEPQTEGLGWGGHENPSFEGLEAQGHV